MKEIEILVQVFEDKDKVLNILKKFDFKGVKKTKDVYFFDPLRDNLKVKNKEYPREWFRLRQKGKSCFVTFKEDIFDKNNEWLHSEEFETKVGNFEVMEKIISHLGFEKLIEIDNTKHTFLTPEYEIVFEEVENLGFFLEVEKLNTDKTDLKKSDIKKIKGDIWDFICSLNLNISPKLNIGKPEMLLKSKICNM